MSITVQPIYTEFGYKERKTSIDLGVKCQGYFNIFSPHFQLQFKTFWTDFENFVNPNNERCSKNINFLSVRIKFCQSNPLIWYFSTLLHFLVAQILRQSFQPRHMSSYFIHELRTRKRRHLLYPRNELGGGVNTGITLSVRLSVCPTVDAWLGKLVKSYFFFPITHIIIKLHIPTPNESRMWPSDFRL